MINKKYKLDDEEQEIEKAIEKGELKTISNFEKERQRIAKLAKATIREKEKDKIITMRINGNDLEKIKIIAKREGLPYQTYIGSIIHKTVANF